MPDAALAPLPGGSWKSYNRKREREGEIDIYIYIYVYTHLNVAAKKCNADITDSFVNTAFGTKSLMPEVYVYRRMFHHCHHAAWVFCLPRSVVSGLRARSCV